ncbi:antitoxin [Kineococcus sp. LSe6-4]|uniref:Antitoxin n=1 Tax=Kineococcus halophytocola TaxID=3234027 RepID=A0ABV4GWZ1_9ACTN
MNYLKGKIGEATDQALHLADQARGRAGSFAAEHSDRAGGAIGKAGEFVNSRTDGRFAGQVTRVSDLARRGVDLAADQAPPSSLPEGGTPMRGGVSSDGTTMRGPVR